jgi:hypothetical protein
MKIFYPLSSAMLPVPQPTQGQVAGAPKAGTANAAGSSVHGSIDLAKERLDEMDAALASAPRDSRAAFDRANQKASRAFKRSQLKESCA